MVPTLSVIAATVLGLMVGVEFAVAFVLNPILNGLPFGASLQARAHGGRMLGRAMPFWYIGSLVLIGGLAVVSWGTPSVVLLVVAAALLIVSIIMSVTLLVPINNRAITWTADNHPADWREQQQRWDSLHYVRVAVIVAAFVLVLVATAAL